MNTGYPGRDIKISFEGLAAAGSLKPLESVPGLQSRSASRAKEPIDITHAESKGWRTLLDQPASKSVDYSLSGVMTSENYRRLMDRWYQDSLFRVSLTHPDSIGFSEGGRFFLGSLESTGEDQGHVAFTCSLMSSGEVKRRYGRLWLLNKDDMYEVDWYTSAATQINKASTPATDVFAATGLGSDVFAYGTPSAAAPFTAARAGKRGMYKYPIASGVGSRVNENAAGDELGAVAQAGLYGLAADPDDPDSLWGVGGGGAVGAKDKSLVKIAVATGIGTAQGQAGFGVGEAQPRGLAFHKGDLIMWGHTADRFYKLDKATGKAEPVIGSGASMSGGAQWESLVSDGHSLFAISSRLLDNPENRCRIAEIDLDALTVEYVSDDPGAGNSPFGMTLAELNGAVPIALTSGG